MARKAPPFRFKKAGYAKAHPGKCKRVSTPSGPRWLCKIGGAAKRRRKGTRGLGTFYEVRGKR